MKFGSIISLVVFPSGCFVTFRPHQMKNYKTSSKMLPLILILIGTALLAIPAAVGTVALLDTSSSQYPGVRNTSGQFLFCISIVGFMLFAGYILTAIFRRHNRIFWFCSMIYNLALSCCYVYVFGLSAGYNPFEAIKLFCFAFPASLILPWTIFVAVASGYYCVKRFRTKNLDLS
jgi:hypothetical protein